MSLVEELDERVREFFRRKWVIREGRSVPSTDSVGLANIGVNVRVTILYADMIGSTKLVDEHNPDFAASVYKSYLYSSAKIIRRCFGQIRSYDGDRIMAVFQGKLSEDRAVRAALGINHIVQEVINPRLAETNPHKLYRLDHRIGIDSGDVLVVQAGIRGGNDLVWVGRPANHAAKLTDSGANVTIRITEEVYRLLSDKYRYNDDEIPLWYSYTWQDMERRVFGTSYWEHI